MIDSINILYFSVITRPIAIKWGPYYSELKRESYDVWMDFHEIKGGQNWEFEIQQAMDSAAIIVAFISNNSITKRGYLQKELRIALEKYQEKLMDDIFLIPVILDDTEIPTEFRSLQVIRENNGNAINDLKESISVQLTRLGDSVSKVQESRGLRWRFHHFKDGWEGLPGYDASYDAIQVYSGEYPQAEEIS